MPHANSRCVLESSALVVMALWLSMLFVGAGLATNSMKLNTLLVAVASAYLAFALFRRSVHWRRVASRCLAKLGTLLLAIGALIALLSALLPGPSAQFGVELTPRGRLIAYQFSRPLTSDSVRVELQRELLPGLYAFRVKALLEPAWDPHMTATTPNALVFSYLDSDGKSQTFRGGHKHRHGTKRSRS